MPRGSKNRAGNAEVAAAAVRYKPFLPSIFPGARDHLGLTVKVGSRAVQSGTASGNGTLDTSTRARAGTAPAGIDSHRKVYPPGSSA
jgi:hypothetical protein